MKYILELEEEDLWILHRLVALGALLFAGELDEALKAAIRLHLGATDVEGFPDRFTRLISALTKQIEAIEAAKP